MTPKDAVALYERAGYIIRRNEMDGLYDITGPRGSQIVVDADKLCTMANQAAKARRDLLPMTLEIPA